MNTNTTTTASTNSTTTWMVITSGTNGDFTIVNDQRDAMKLQFAALSKKFFERQNDR